MSGAELALVDKGLQFMNQGVEFIESPRLGL